MFVLDVYLNNFDINKNKFMDYKCFCNCLYLLRITTSILKLYMGPGMIRVTLLTFSGLEDYYWYYYDLDYEMNSRWLLGLFRDNIKGINFGETCGKLGFSGFLVEIDGTEQTIAHSYGLTNSFYICDGRAPDLYQSRYLGFTLMESSNQNSNFKSMIFQDIINLQQDTSDCSEGDDPDEDLHNETRHTLHDVNNDELYTVNILSPKTGKLITVQAGLFNTTFWNTSEKQKLHNCYSYACNYAGGHYYQPGGNTEKLLQERTMKVVIDGAMSDGLIMLDDYRDEKYYPNHVVALFATDDYADDWDYHWYRLVLNNKHERSHIWAHKPGKMSVRKTDNKNKIIKDPRNAERGKYTQFGGYFIVSNQVKIK
ncbi:MULTISPECIES: hypothetical protein [Xenorhabdus]|uniref:hypothetical protein n=1 Tax=Xenorhabdus TaxID=626 RepID=UPI000A989F57|nr:MULTISPECIES: hypothetical protein [Xenorhabdus]MBC8946269.1 hypothetical protein [Xenorhabdus indica]